MRQAVFIVALALGLVVQVLAQEASTVGCAKISVIGPSGVTNPGDVAVFAVQVDKPLPSTAQYEWTVSAGTVVAGLGTGTITVDTGLSGSEITARVTVKGLHDLCDNTASETAPIDPVCGLPISDEYGKASRNEERARLDFMVVPFKQATMKAILFVEIKIAKSEKRLTVQKRMARISDYLIGVRGLPKDSLKFGFAEGDFSWTRITLLPADFPLYSNLADNLDSVCPARAKN